MAGKVDNKANVVAAGAGAVGVLTPELLAALKAELKAELKEEVKAEAMAELEADIEAKREAAEKASEERALQGEKLLEQQEMNTLAKLKAEKHVPILIPLSEIGDNSPVPVGINGVVYTIPRGKEFSVPQSIYTQWKNSYEKTLAANARIVNKRIDEAELEIRD